MRVRAARRPVLPVAVLTADVIGSSRYSPADRRKLDRILRNAFTDVERRFQRSIHTGMAFRITAGDEFQCVIADVARAFDILTYVRAAVATGGLDPPLRFRASLGVGALSTAKRENPYEEDGPAFVRSRRGLEEMVRGRGPARWTKLVTGDAEFDLAMDVVLGLADYVQQHWTVPQWEAVRWSLLGLTREAIARKLKIAHQNVTKRLMAAGWPQLETASGFIRDVLSRRFSGTRPRVHSAGAPA